MAGLAAFIGIVSLKEKAYKTLAFMLSAGLFLSLYVFKVIFFPSTNGSDITQLPPSPIEPAYILIFLLAAIPSVWLLLLSCQQLSRTWSSISATLLVAFSSVGLIAFTAWVWVIGVGPNAPPPPPPPLPVPSAPVAPN
jgi:hypothetical protein